MPIVTVTFTPNNPQQTFVCNPDPAPVPYGLQTVTWNLSGPAGATFAATDGIYFKDQSPGTLTRVSNSQYQLSDNNTNQSGSTIDYPYGINVSYNNQTYNFDPEVANESGGGKALRYHPR